MSTTSPPGQGPERSPSPPRIRINLSRAKEELAKARSGVDKPPEDIEGLQARISELEAGIEERDEIIDQQSAQNTRLRRQVQNLLRERSASGQPNLAEVAQVIKEGRDLPPELLEALKAAGWADPAQREAIEQTSDSNLQKAATAETSNSQLRQELSQERRTSATLKDQLTIEQEAHAATSIDLAKAQAEVERLQNFIDQTTPGETPSSETLDSTAAEFRRYCDRLFTASNEVEPGRPNPGLSTAARVETQTTFLNKDEADLNSRIGIYRLENWVYGNPVSFIGNPTKIGIEVMGEVSPQGAKEIGDALELLAKSDMTGELRVCLSGPLLAARVYRESVYSHSDTTEAFFVGALPERADDTKFIKREFYMNLPAAIHSLNRINTLLQQLDSNPLLHEIGRSFNQIIASPLYMELDLLMKANPDIFKADYKADLQSATLGGEKASDVLIDVFKRHKTDYDLLTQASKQLVVLLPLAEHHKEMSKLTSIETPRVVPQGNSVVIQQGRNPYAVLLSTAGAGRSFSETEAGEPWYSKYEVSDSIGRKWPPEASFQLRQHIGKTLGHEKPIDLEIRPDRPIILFTGNNGGGKTRAMETVVQTLADALTTGTNNTAKVVRTSELREIRSLVGASKHSDQLSSFQREAFLIADALKTLSNKPQNERGILVVDEVGKGTDSRDAIALMTAVAEYCRRNNIYLLMATHHGQEFVTLAEKLGLRGSMRIMSPDLETHQLQEFDSPQTSKGVEVMRTRAEGRLPDGVLAALVENALRIRTAVETDAAPQLVPVVVEPQAGAGQFSFSDNQTLKDLGLWHERRFGRTEGLEATVAIRGMAKAALGLDPLYRDGAAWDSWFMKKQATVATLSESGLAQERDLIRAYVEFVRSSPTGVQGFLHEANETYKASLNLLCQGFSDHERDAKITQMIVERQENYLKGDLMTGEGARQYDEGRGLAGGPVEFILQFGERDTRARTFTSLRSFAQTLISSGQEALVHSGQNLLSMANLEKDMNRIVDAAAAKEVEVLNSYMTQRCVRAIRNNQTRLTDQDALSLGARIGMQPGNSQQFFEGIAQAVEMGDKRVYEQFCRWLIDGQKAKSPTTSYFYSRTESPQDRLYSDSLLEDVVKIAQKIEKSRHDIVQAGVPTGISPSGNFETQIIDRLLRGDSSALISMTAIARQQNIYFSYGEGNQLAAAIRGLEDTKWVNWLQFIEKENAPTTTEDLYSVMGVSAAASEDEIRRTYRTLARDNHPDLMYARLDMPRELRGGAVASLPEEYRVPMLAAQARFEEVKKAYEILADSEKRGAYDRGRSIDTATDLPYYATWVNAITQLNWCEPTYSTDGSLDIRGSLGINLLSKLDVSQIARQSVSISPENDAMVIGGSNGNGKSQTLLQLGVALELGRRIGFVPAESAVLPKASFVSAMVNAGESTEGKSSFQGEIDRYIDLVDRYIKAGAPKDGYIFLDEPLAGTSSPDQIGILLSIIEFFRQRDVKVVFTNHNYKMYEFLRRTTGSDGSNINFKPVAFLTGSGRVRFQLEEFDPRDTNAIRSDGIKVTGEVGTPNGLPGGIIDIAYFARDALTGSTGVNF